MDSLVLIKFEGGEYQYETIEITVKQAKVIKAHTGLGLVSWSAAIDDELDADSVQALFWVVRDQNGVTEPPIDSLNFAIPKFIAAYRAADAEAIRAAKKATTAPKATGSVRSERRASSKPARTA